MAESKVLTSSYTCDICGNAIVFNEVSGMSDGYGNLTKSATRGVTVSKYIGFVSYTPEAWALMVDQGLDREGSIRDILREAGGTLENAYWLYSQYDLVGVFEIPDEIDAMAVRYAAFRSGHLRQLEFLPVVSSEHNAQMQRRAKELSQSFKHPHHAEAHRHPGTASQAM